MDNILLLGTNGFLGKHVAKILKKNNIKFKAIKGKKSVDITDLHKFDQYVKDLNINCIINCAAFVGGISFGYKYPAELLNINSQMAINIYEIAKKYNIKKIINPISNCAYPGNQKKYTEKNFWHGLPHESVLNYGLSKRFLISQGNAFFNQYRISSYNVVLSNMYGPEDHFDEERSHALGALIKKISYAKMNNLDSIEIWGSGRPIREWLYVEDGANAIVKSINLPFGNYLFNVGVNKGYSITEIAEFIAKEFNWKGSLDYNHSKPDGVMEKTVDGKYGESLLNWSPEIKLDVGISKTVNWYINNYGK